LGRLPDKSAGCDATPLERGFETQFKIPAFPFVGSCPASGEPWPAPIQKTGAAAGEISLSIKAGHFRPNSFGPRKAIAQYWRLELLAFI
jgi:hypothetical protein